MIYIFLAYQHTVVKLFTVFILGEIILMSKCKRLQKSEISVTNLNKYHFEDA